jgi:hypothetical protein
VAFFDAHVPVHRVPKKIDTIPSNIFHLHFNRIANYCELTGHISIIFFLFLEV